MLKKGMSLDQLIACIRFEPDKLNSRYVNVIRATKDKDYHVITKTHEPTDNVRIHRQVIKQVFSDNTTQKVPTFIVSCTCPRWMYMWEYAMAKRGAAQIIYGNGEPPSETNPSLSPGICKHVFKALLYIKSNYFSS